MTQAGTATASNGRDIQASTIMKTGKPTITRDFIELTKPRIAVLVLISVAAGAYLAGELYPHRFSWLLLFHAVFGSGLVAGGASALNQVLEKKNRCAHGSH